MIKPDLLVIESNEIVAGLYSRVLTAQGWNVDIRADESAAEEALRSTRHYDLILMGYRVSGTDGVALIRRIRSVEPRTTVPILMVTGTYGIEFEARHAGADDVLLKPIDMARLVETARRLMIESACDCLRCEAQRA